MKWFGYYEKATGKLLSQCTEDVRPKEVKSGCVEVDLGGYDDDNWDENQIWNPETIQYEPFVDTTSTFKTKTETIDEILASVDFTKEQKDKLRATLEGKL